MQIMKIGEFHIPNYKLNSNNNTNIYFLTSFLTATHNNIVITISGSVFPTGISTRIRHLYRTNPTTQITIFITSALPLLLSLFRKKKSAI